MGVLASIIPMVGKPRGEIVLPPFTVRFKANKAVSTNDFHSSVRSLITLSLVDDSTHTYDVKLERSDWSFLFSGATPIIRNKWLLEIVDSNTSGVTNMSYMFQYCDMLIKVPLLNTSSVTNASYILIACKNVESGAFALYTQMSTQPNPPSLYVNAFTNCGADTPTGLAELQQIPTSWGGLAT